MFEEYIVLFLFFFMLIDMTLDQLMLRIILHEGLLICPINASIVVNEFIMTLGAKGLEDFLVAQMIHMCLLIIGRIYLNPLIETLQ